MCIVAAVGAHRDVAAEEDGEQGDHVSASAQSR